VVKVQVSLSAEVSYLSTIWGRMRKLLVLGKQRVIDQITVVAGDEAVVQMDRAPLRSEWAHS